MMPVKISGDGGGSKKDFIEGPCLLVDRILSDC
jgi:hypothetical protein